MPRPFLLMDVDGVLALRTPAPARYLEYTIVASTGRSDRVWLHPDHGRWLTSLAEHFDVVWATGWEQDAPRLLGDLLGVPRFPVLEFTDRPRHGRSFSKLPDVRRLVRIGRLRGSMMTSSQRSRYGRRIGPLRPCWCGPRLVPVC